MFSRAIVWFFVCLGGIEVCCSQDDAPVVDLNVDDCSSWRVEPLQSLLNAAVCHRPCCRPPVGGQMLWRCCGGPPCRSTNAAAVLHLLKLLPKMLTNADRRKDQKRTNPLPPLEKRNCLHLNDVDRLAVELLFTRNKQKKHVSIGQAELECTELNASPSQLTKVTRWQRLSGLA